MCISYKPYCVWNVYGGLGEVVMKGRNIWKCQKVWFDKDLQIGLTVVHISLLTTQFFIENIVHC